MDQVPFAAFDKITLLVAVVLTIGLGALISAVTAAHYTDMRDARRAAFDPIVTSLNGVNIAQLAVGVLWVLLISGEYATGMIRSSLTAVPERLPVDATESIVQAGLDTKILILTTFDMDEYVDAGLRAGASGFLLKDVLPAELISALRSVAAGDAVIAPSASRRLLVACTPMLPTPQRGQQREQILQALTEREREVFPMVAAALTNREISLRLHVSESTVKVHVSRILAKLQLRDRVQIVVLAYESGLVVPTS